MLLRRKCPRPEWINPDSLPPEKLMTVKLPDKEKVITKLYKVVKDDTIRIIIRSILDEIYSLKDDHDFMRWLKTNAIRYRVTSDEEHMIDYMLAMTLAFADYCDKEGLKRNVAAIAAKGLNPEDVKDKHCLVLIQLVQEIRSTYGEVRNYATAGRLALKWKRETNKIKKLWYNIEKNWCRW